jgi:alcohol dehydrogenase class IV
MPAPTSLTGDFTLARRLLREFKGQNYAFGEGALAQTGALTAPLGNRAGLIRPAHPGSDTVVSEVTASLRRSGVSVAGVLAGSRPNTPREDVLRLADELAALDADVMVAIGGGSNLDAAKAAGVLRSLGGTIDGYLGSGRVTAALHAGGRTLTPLVAVQTAASSAAHLTRYSNLTDLAAAQKKLIVDDAIVPPAAVFQYDVTHSTPAALAADGALDGHSHALEVLYGAVGQPNYEKIEQVALEAIRLVVHNLETVIHNLHDARARTALGLATDLGGYAIMLGGTNGGHLTSFSLTDVLSHGRACAILNPYYTILFAAAIEDPLRAVGNIYRTAGLIRADPGRLHGRELALAVAEGMRELSQRVGVPTSLSEVRGLGPAHIARALAAAKDPQLKMKLDNMPIPLRAELVDETIGSVLAAAWHGDLNLVREAI